MTVLGFENRIRKFFYALCLTLVCVVVSPLSVYSENYSVSYLWHSDLSKISVYKKKILVFSTRIVSRIHSHLLKSSGLEPAVVIKSRDWKPQNKKIALPERLASGAQAKKITSKPEDPLEDEIEKYIKSQRRRGVIRSNERTAWVVYDFKTDKKIVSINEDVPMEAASLIKPFIALAFFRGVESGKYIYGKKSRRLMEKMIRKSDNPSADWFLRLMGGPRSVQKILKKYYGGIFKNTRLVEYIRANGRTYRNKASAHDYSRFLYSLWKDKLSGSKEIKRLMNLPNADRFYTSTPGVPKGTEVYDKTGTTSHLCGNMGILVAQREDGREYPYIVVGIIEKDSKARNYSRWMRTRGDIIRHVSEITYERISGHHKFEDFESLTASSGGSEKQE